MENTNFDLIERLRKLHKADFDAVVVCLPDDAGKYVSDRSQAERANELVVWAQTAGRLAAVDELLRRLEQKGDDPLRYLSALHALTAHIDIRGLAVGSGRVHRFPIEELYIPLTAVTWVIGAIKTEDGQAPAKDAERGGDAMPGGRQAASTMGQHALQTALREPKLVIIGDPGAGKSTFLNRIAAALCDAWLPNRDPKAAATRLGLADRPLPLLIRVAELAEYIRCARARNEGSALGPASPDWLEHYLGATAAANNWGLNTADLW